MKMAGMMVEVEEAMELEDQLHKRLKQDPSLLAATESGTEPVTEPIMEAVTKPITELALGAVTEPVTEFAMEAVMKPPETIWKSM
uniref:Uncharacterized protein n=1 Tax=Quercus lobata TaxID=97700 RepID=A0A7N2LPJ8_QUELO